MSRFRLVGWLFIAYFALGAGLATALPLQPVVKQTGAGADLVPVRAYGGDSTSACIGDCNADAAVTIDELLRGVNIALGLGAVDNCAALDRNGDAGVTIDELLAAVNYALNGCPLTPTPTPSATLSASRTLTATDPPTQMPAATARDTASPTSTASASPLPSATATVSATPTALQSATATPASLHFTDVTEFAGVHYVQSTFAPLATEQDIFSGGAAAADFDGDGWVDLFATRLDQPSLLFHNNGDGTFTDVSTASGLAAFNLRANGAAWGDIDNDGDPDLYVTTIGADQRRYNLFINDGSGHFTEEAMQRGAAVFGEDPHYGFSVTFGDYDRDGFLDMHLTEWRPLYYNTKRVISNTRLLHNRGVAAPGYFEDVTAAAGVSIDGVAAVSESVGRGLTFSSRFADMDDDGWPDLLIVADFGTSRLFWNDGNGHFTDGTLAAALGTDENGMGSAVGDFDGDGRLDWFITSIWDPRRLCVDTFDCFWGTSGNRLFRNMGARHFVDVTDAAGVRQGGWGWGAAFWDYDNDCDLDLVMTNGVYFPQLPIDREHLDDDYEHDPTRLFRNDGFGAMSDVAAALGLANSDAGKGLLTFDYDRDGDLDLFVVNNLGAPVLYRNDGGNQAHWLRVKVIGTQSNRDGIGARVRVTAAPSATPQLREIDAGSHYLGQSELTAHFGLGASDAPVFLLEVIWPKSGVTQRFENVAPDQTLTVTEPSR